MTTSKLIGFAIGALIALSPAVALAQSTTTGLLQVYVQVLNPQSGYVCPGCNIGMGYNTYQPGNFSVAVAGQSPSLTSFPGSQQGTSITLGTGSYSVSLSNIPPYLSPNYSTGCSGTISANQTQLCVITVSASPYSTPNPVPYSYTYGYNLPPFTCAPAYQTVNAGQTATFNAVGGLGGTYNWMVGGRTYANAGPTLSLVLSDAGAQLVTVTNASQTASCSVNVQTGNGYIPNPTVYTYNPYTTSPSYNPYSTTYPYNTTYPYYNNATGPYYSGTYPTYAVAPTLPRTGFAPTTATGWAFAVVLLIGAGFAAYPYARKAIVTLG
ncbi:MAG: hypothetical protein KGI70_02790 [Patescibacteria group bacterium]|nr:hypothetical protein [Patescibacteria group bacterium]